MILHSHTRHSTNNTEIYSRTHQHSRTQVRKLAAKSPRSRRQEDDDELMNNEGTNLFAKLLEEKLRT